MLNDDTLAGVAATLTAALIPPRKVEEANQPTMQDLAFVTVDLFDVVLAELRKRHQVDPTPEKKSRMSCLG